MTWAIPAKVDGVLEIVIRAVPGDFVRVSLSGCPCHDVLVQCRVAHRYPPRGFLSN